MIKPKILVSIPESLLKSISTPEAEAILSSFADVIKNDKDEQYEAERLQDVVLDVDGIITSWGSPMITKDIIEKARMLKIIGHAAGSVKPYVCKEVFDRGIVVISAAPEIAYSVAEYTLTQMLNCLRELPDYARLMKNGTEQEFKHTYYEKGICKDLTGKKIGLIGSGNVVRRLVQLLHPFDVEISVYDPYLYEEEANFLGVKKVSLENILSGSDIISVHAASTSETRHMIDKGELELIPDGVVFINSARGALINEAD